MQHPTPPIRHLVLVLGDQLDLNASALQNFDPQHDVVWMAEVMQESTHVPSAKQRTALFLSAMRHFAQALRAQAGRCITPSWTMRTTAAPWRAS